MVIRCRFSFPFLVRFPKPCSPFDVKEGKQEENFSLHVFLLSIIRRRRKSKKNFLPIWLSRMCCYFLFLLRKYALARKRQKIATNISILIGPKEKRQEKAKFKREKCKHIKKLKRNLYCWTFNIWNSLSLRYKIVYFANSHNFNASKTVGNLFCCQTDAKKAHTEKGEKFNFSKLLFSHA